MTFYLFAYWMITLGVLVLVLDRRHWWQHGLRLGSRCADRSSLGTLGNAANNYGMLTLAVLMHPPEFLASMLKHVQDVVSTLGIHLFIGDWVTSLPQKYRGDRGFSSHRVANCRDDLSLAKVRSF